MRFVFTIPVYNSEPWIERCLQSVKYQTYSNWIALVVGDPSTDKTNDIIKKFIAGCDKFIFTENDTRKYMMANRVESIKKANLDDLVIFRLPPYLVLDPLGNFLILHEIGHEFAQDKIDSKVIHKTILLK